MKVELISSSYDAKPEFLWHLYFPSYIRSLQSTNTQCWDLKVSFTLNIPFQVWAILAFFQNFLDFFFLTFSIILLNFFLVTLSQVLILASTYSCCPFLPSLCYIKMPWNLPKSKQKSTDSLLNNHISLSSAYFIRTLFLIWLLRSGVTWFTPLLKALSYIILVHKLY